MTRADLLAREIAHSVIRDYLRATPGALAAVQVAELTAFLARRLAPELEACEAAGHQRATDRMRARVAEVHGEFAARRVAR